MKNLIGISGKLGSGKDTVGLMVQYLTDRYAIKDKLSFIEWLEEKEQIESGLCYTASDWEIRKYADKLKDIVCFIIGCTREQLEDREFKNSPLSSDWDDSHGINTPRELLQVLGTDCGRDMIHTNLWTIALFADYKPLDVTNRVSMGNVIDYSNCDFPKWVITDMRFPNELSYIKDRGGITIRVNRDNLIKDASMPHPSETALDNSTFDYVIDNRGTFDELLENVREILIKESII